MENIYWHKQGQQKPLFEDILWSRPENKSRAGKLLIIGGNAYAFAAPAAAFAAAAKAGIGSTRVLLPDKLKKTIGANFAEAEFGESTPSGGFSRKALAHAIELAEWSDGVILAGDFGRNSETAILLEKLIGKYKGQITVAQDGLDYFWDSASPLLTRPRTASVINLGKLQKLAKNNRPQTPILHNMNLKELVEILHDWTTGNEGNIITKHAGQIIVAAGGKLSTTAMKNEANWQIELAAYISVWWLQLADKPFEALSTATYSYIKDCLKVKWA